MLRQTAMQNFVDSERIVNVVANNIPALPAKIFNGNSIQEIDSQFYLVFDWLNGKSLKPNEVNIANCLKVGTILADIHMTDFSELSMDSNYPYNIQLTDWNYYLLKGRETDSEWVNLLSGNIDSLYKWDAQANESARLLSSDMVISHRDLDPKNVMWNKKNPIIIDWESAGFVNPMHELIETAVYWSENEAGGVDKERFLAFISGYKERKGKLHANWKTVLENGLLGKLGWLEYSLKRSLWIECTDREEQQMGTAQVSGTIRAIKKYSYMVTELENWINTELE
jgi:thiamine kinase-like enzyme